MTEEPSKKAHVCNDNDDGIPCQRSFGSKETLFHHLKQSHFGTECLWPGCGDPHHTSVEEVIKCLYRHNKEATTDPTIFAWPGMPRRQLKTSWTVNRALKQQQKKTYQRNGARNAATSSAMASAVSGDAADPTDADVDSDTETRSSQAGGLYDVASLPGTGPLSGPSPLPAPISLASVAPPVADTSFGVGSGGHHGMDGTFYGEVFGVGACKTTYLCTAPSHNGDQIYHDSHDGNVGNGYKYQSQQYPGYNTQGFDEEGYGYEGYNVQGCLDPELIDPRIRDL